MNDYEVQVLKFSASQNVGLFMPHLPDHRDQILRWCHGPALLDNPGWRGRAVQGDLQVAPWPGLPRPSPNVSGSDMAYAGQCLTCKAYPIWIASGDVIKERVGSGFALSTPQVCS